MITWKAVICLPLMLWNLTNPSPVREIPIMHVSFYLMGVDSVDQALSASIYKNIRHLNREFEDMVQFSIKDISTSSSTADLPELYTDFHENDQKLIDSLILPIEKSGGINVFVFDTHVDETGSAALMGFSPRLVSGYDIYESISPAFDRIYMAYEGLEDMTTLVHEMGHFFGLSHPWELSEDQKKRCGIHNALDASQNHMSYGPDVHQFTPQQLLQMHEYILDYRKYLMKGILKKYDRT